MNIFLCIMAAILFMGTVAEDKSNKELSKKLCYMFIAVMVAIVVINAPWL